MKKLLWKVAVMSSICMCSVGVVLPSVVAAQEYKSVQNQPYQYSNSELIEIIDPYIVENFYSYSIQNKEELLSKIGLDNFKKLEARLEVANQEKLESLNRDAVRDIHIAILREAGASVESLWWGKRINTYDRTTAIKVRKLANAFCGDSGNEGLAYTLVSVGIGFVPGFGVAAGAAGIALGALTWADSTTWNTVATKVADKIDNGEYALTIDINAWYIDVEVY